MRESYFGYLMGKKDVRAPKVTAEQTIKHTGNNILKGKKILGHYSLYWQIHKIQYV